MSAKGIICRAHFREKVETLAHKRVTDERYELSEVEDGRRRHSTTGDGQRVVSSTGLPAVQSMLLTIVDVCWSAISLESGNA